jgi:hypothetical protein
LATTGLALCFVQFLQTVCTAFCNTVGIRAFVGLFSAAFSQTFLLQTISTAFGNTFGVGTFVGLFSTAFSQAFVLQTFSTAFGNAFGIGTFVGLLRTVFSYTAFGVVTVLLFLRTAASQVW